MVAVVTPDGHVGQTLFAQAQIGVMMNRDSPELMTGFADNPAVGANQSLDASTSKQTRLEILPTATTQILTVVGES